MTSRVKKFLRISLTFLVISTAVLLVLTLVLRTYVRSSSFRTMILSYLKDNLSIHIVYDTADLGIMGGPGIILDKVSLEVPEQVCAYAPRMKMTLSPIALVTGGDLVSNLEPEDVTFEGDYDRMSEKGGGKPTSIPKITVNGGLIRFYIHGQPLTFSGDIRGSIKIKAGGTLLLNGRMDFYNALMTYQGMRCNLNGRVMFMGREVASENLSASEKDMLVVLNGRVYIQSPMRYAGDVRLEGMKFPSNDRGLPGMDFILTSIEGDANLTISKSSILGMPVENLESKARIHNRELRLDECVATGKGLNGKGTAIIGVDGMKHFKVNFESNRLQLADMILGENTKNSWIDGILYVKGDLTYYNDSLNGDIAAAAFNGHIRRFSTLAKVFEVVNIYRLIVKQNPDFRQSGFSYNQIVAHAVIKNSVARLKHFYLDSNSIQVSATGEYHFNPRRIDVTLAIHPLETIDKIVGSIPIAGYILVGKDKSIISMYVNVVGPIDDPVIKPVALNTFSSPVIGILKRTLMLPYTIFSDPKSLIPALKK